MSLRGLDRGNKSLNWLWQRWNHWRKPDTAFRKIYDLQAESLWWSNGYNSTVLDDIPGSYGEAAHFHTAVQECNFDGRICAWELPDMTAGLHIRWETDIHYTVAIRSSSLFNHKRDTTSKQLLISEEKQSLNKNAKSMGVVKDFLLTMMQSLIGPWEGLTKPKI